MADLVPYVDRNFRTIHSSTSRAIAGLSMGGAQSLYIGLNNPDVFAWIGSFSAAIIAWPGAMMPVREQAPTQGTGPLIPHFELNAGSITRSVPDLNEHINSKLRLLYISCGTDDGLLTSNLEFESWLKAHDIHFISREVPGYAHVWSLWRRNLVEVAPMLFRSSSAAQAGR